MMITCAGGALLCEELGAHARHASRMNFAELGNVRLVQLRSLLENLPLQRELLPLNFQLRQKLRRSRRHTSAM